MEMWERGGGRSSTHISCNTVFTLTQTFNQYTTTALGIKIATLMIPLVIHSTCSVRKFAFSKVLIKIRSERQTIQ